MSLICLERFDFWNTCCRVIKEIPFVLECLLSGSWTTCFFIGIFFLSVSFDYLILIIWLSYWFYSFFFCYWILCALEFESWNNFIPFSFERFSFCFCDHVFRHLADNFPFSCQCFISPPLDVRILTKHFFADGGVSLCVKSIADQAKQLADFFVFFSR